MEVVLASGHVLIIDDEDADLIGGYKWRVKDGINNHVKRGTSFIKEGKKVNQTIYLHRLILEKHGHCLDGMHVDHINRNPLDCRKSNLRVALCRENARNTSLRKDNTSGFKGVSKASRWGWQAAIRVDGKRIYLGTFKTPEEAYEVYKKAAKEYHQNFANL